MMPVGTAGMNDIPAHLVGKASALANTIRNIFGSVSVTLVATIISTRMNLNYAILADQITPFNQTAVDTVNSLQRLYMSSGLVSADAQVSALSTITGLVVKQAYLDAIDYAAAFTAIAVVIAVLLVLMMRTTGKYENLGNEENRHEAKQQLAIVLD
jgi:hypothetical protein